MTDYPPFEKFNLYPAVAPTKAVSGTRTFLDDYIRELLAANLAAKKRNEELLNQIKSKYARKETSMATKKNKQARKRELKGIAPLDETWIGKHVWIVYFDPHLCRLVIPRETWIVEEDPDLEICHCDGSAAVTVITSLPRGDKFAPPNCLVFKNRNTAREFQAQYGATLWTDVADLLFQAGISADDVSYYSYI